MLTKDEVARNLARRHYQVEDGISTIIRINGNAEAEFCPNEPIKLLEVNANTVPSGVMPLQFGPAPDAGIDYASVIVEVTPEEFRKIQSRELKLPTGWNLGEVISRPENGSAE